MSDRFNEDFLTDIAELYKKYDISYSDIEKSLQREIRKEQHNRIIKESEKNLNLLGKCFKRKTKPEIFPEVTRYYKVISIQSKNEVRVECLVFDNEPKYYFDYQSSMVGNPGDYYLGSFYFDSIWTEDEMASSIRHMEEISLEEYNQAMRDYIDKLIALPWYAEHYRGCNKFPSDPLWPKEKYEEHMKNEKRNNKED